MNLIETLEKVNKIPLDKIKKASELIINPYKFQVILVKRNCQNVRYITNGSGSKILSSNNMGTKKRDQKERATLNF